MTRYFLWFLRVKVQSCPKTFLIIILESRQILDPSKLFNKSKKVLTLSWIPEIFLIFRDKFFFENSSKNLIRWCLFMPNAMKHWSKIWINYLASEMSGWPQGIISRIYSIPQGFKGFEQPDSSSLAFANEHIKNFGKKKHNFLVYVKTLIIQFPYMKKILINYQGCGSDNRLINKEWINEIWMIVPVVTQIKYIW